MSRSLLSRPLAVVVGLALLLALGGFVSTPPAHAVDPLTVFVRCDSGLYQFDCSLSASGGVPAYTYAWQIVAGGATITSDPTLEYVDGSCSGTGQSIKVTVQDSVGTTVVVTRAFQCRAGPWR